MRDQGVRLGGGACKQKRTVKRFFEPPTDGGPNLVFEGPGRDNKAFPPPTFRDPSLIALDEDVNGSGAATFESFWFPKHGED